MSDEIPIESHDERERHCRMLGHAVKFCYCRRLPEGHPCRLIADCWYEHFDVMAYLQAHYTPAQIAAFTSPPKPKITSILEMIEKAKKRAEED